MKTLFTLLISCAFTVSFGQELKKITQKNDNDCFKVSEVYYVLKDKQEIKHGGYRKDMGRLSERGQYNNGKKSGVWEYYGLHGLEQKIDYDRDSVIFGKSFDNLAKVWLLDGNEVIENKTNQLPLFTGGAIKWGYILSRCMRYPAEALERNIQGKIMVSATITENGEIINEKVEEGPDYGFHEEALRVIKLIPDDWMPGKINGRPVAMKVLIPLAFTLAG